MLQRPMLTLRDIAEAARVRRAVVSMWRRRSYTGARGTVPFPKPVSSPGDVVVFDRDEIVEYLRMTGRGNNPEVAQDVLALSAPDGVDIEDVVTLLCLHALTGEEFGGCRELAELAFRADPRDELLLREVRAMTLTDDVTHYVDDLVEGSFGPADALTRLEATRLRRRDGVRGLTEPLVELLKAVVGAARDVVGPDEAVLVPSVEGTLFRRLADGFAAVALGHHEARSVRRRALVAEMPVDHVVTGPAVRVLSVVGSPDPDILTQVHDLVLDLGPRDVGIVLGAASTLCDPLVGEASEHRTDTLGDGVLAAAIRLPRGLWKGAHRQSLALWVLNGARGNEFVSLADLETETIDPADLAADVSAALLEPTVGAVAGRRALRYARRIDAVTMLGRAAVVPRGVRALRFGTTEAASYLDRVYTATLTTSRAVDGFDVLAAAAAPARVVRRRIPLAELASDGRLTMKRGIRINTVNADPDGTVPVLSADGSTDEVRFDPFDAARLHPRAARTEPGDVIVVEKPRPRARVDTRGGALVAAPSRILRLEAHAPVRPHVLAAVVNSLTLAGGDWMTWNVPELPDADLAALDAALAGIAKHQDELRRHTDAAGDLVASLIEGVAAGAVTLDPILTRPEAG